jgi:hypothetical protein
MKAYSKAKVLLICLALLIFAAPALAGGWATVTLDQMPGEIRAGETVHLSFVVRQHGETPIHYVAHLENAPMEPHLTARNLDTGETLRIAAERGTEVGHFTLEVVFPSEGEWEWEITPEPLVGATEFKPLTVLPVAKKAKADTSPGNTVPASPNALVSPQAFQVAGAILIAVALAAVFAFVIIARRRKMATQTGR